MICFHVSDLHGRRERYEKLFAEIIKEKPDVVLMGGDLLPHGISDNQFISGYFKQKLIDLKKNLRSGFPEFLVILGNDDPKKFEKDFVELSNENLIYYLNLKKVSVEDYDFYGYSYVPPTPFRMKDWDKYDISRYTDPGIIPPEEGYFSTDRSQYDIKYSTIKEDLQSYLGGKDISKSVILFHTPPYNTKLDLVRPVLIDYVETDKHAGSIAVRNLIELKQPLVTLHGHLHESSQLSGAWRDRIGKTYCFNAAFHKPELSIIKFDPSSPQEAKRILI
ncbi:metallophosphoesterase family protein [Melioribacter sp. Ez-97]|uniref:metallophosphoesterase family protein n=1 Tax=Melioribacter sp. Ez-97 TaxID=3423434 RepID=UPI003EDB1131